MADPILYGETFGSDLRGTFPDGLPITWSPYEIYGRANLTAQQNTNLNGVIAAHDPTLPYVKPLSATEQLLFEHENRLRSLEGQPPLTLDDFVVLLKGNAPT